MAIGFNGEKCTNLRLARGNTAPPAFTYHMGPDGNKVPLKVVKAEKDLGVKISCDLKVGAHVEEAVAKATRVAFTVKRTLTFRDKNTVTMLHKALIRPILEYSNTAWRPTLAKDIEAIEKVQRRVTKMIPEIKDLPYQTRLRECRLPTLEHRRRRGDMIEAYKLTHELYQLAPPGIIKLASGRTATRGHPYKMQVTTASTNLGLNKFSRRIVKEWNNLPSAVVCAKSLNSFKSSLDVHWRDVESKYDYKIRDY